MKKLIILLSIILMSSGVLADPQVPKNPWPPTDTIEIPMTFNDDLTVTGDAEVEGDVTIKEGSDLSMEGADISANSGTIKAMPDAILANGTAIGCTGGGCASGRTFVTLGQPYRLKNSKPIKQIKFYREGSIEAACSWISFEVVRGNGDNAGTTFPGGSGSTYVPDVDQEYTIVETTGNIITNMATQCSSGGSCTFTLPSEFTLNQRGDYLAGTIVASSTCQIWGHTNTDGNSYIFWTAASASGSEVDFHGGSSTANVQIVFEAYTDPTTLAVTGDSLAQGSTANRDFMKSQATTTDLTTNIAYHLSEASDDLGGTKWTYQSLGRSGITMANTEAYFDKTSVDCTANTCVLDLLPEIAYVVAGHNDVATGVAQSTTLTALTGMLDACEVQRAAGALTRCMVLGVPPWTAGTDTQMRLIDDLNMAMSELTAGYNNAMFIDSTIYTGKARATGPLGNLWDIQTSPDYNDDNTHLNSAGYAQVAQASWDLYNSIAWSTATDNTPVLIVSKDSQQVGVGGYPANGNALTVAGNIGATGNLHLGGSVRFGTSELITETVEISAATLNGAAAVTVISAKGTDTLIEFVSAILPFKDATDYDTCDATSEFVFQYETSGDDVSDEFESVGFIDGGADAIRIVSALSQKDVDITANTNKAIQILNTGTQCANGTGVIHSKITYRVYALGL